MPTRDGYLVVMSVQRWRDLCREYDRMKRRIQQLEKELEAEPMAMRGVDPEEWR